MKIKIKEAIVVILLVGVLPMLMIQLISRKNKQMRIDFTETATISTTQSREQKTVALTVLRNGVVETMELEEYLCGVVQAEMPVSFDEQALKAQAVVARTYTLKRYTNSGKHKDAIICTDPSCCQAYVSGDIDAKVKQAVKETSGQVLFYEGKLIEATYFSCSGGRTEDALAVWGVDIPYLQAVDSPGEEAASHYVDTVQFSAREFSDRLGLSLTGLPETWFGNIAYTDGGGVATIQIGGNEIDGVTLRQKLGLRSTAFVITAIGETITVTTKGFGHRVGMSQYGAEAMAVQGADYREILAHYYPETVLTQWVYD